MSNKPSALAMRAAEKIAGVVWPKLGQQAEQAEQGIVVLAHIIDAAYRPLVETLEKARHALATTHNLRATDKPALWPNSLGDFWDIDNNAEIKALDAALALVRERGKP